MVRFAQLVMGPAGAGKSTYCSMMEKHFQNVKRTVHIVNLDPAAEVFNYEPSVNIKDLISVEDVMEELGYGPNGALVYCMEFLMSKIEWFEEQIGTYEDDYLIFDLPGQIELYTHLDIMRQLVNTLQRLGFNCCAVFLLDSHFMSDSGKFLAGTLQTLSTMIHLEIAHVNVITKMDLLPPNSDESQTLEKFFDADVFTILEELSKNTPKKLHTLNTAIGNVIDEYSLVSFLALNKEDEQSIGQVLQAIDHALQWDDEQEPREPKDAVEVEF